MSVGNGGLELDRYRDVAPGGALDALLRLAERARRRRIVHVSSTRIGGGVAEILQRLVPLMRELELDAEWAVLEGDLVLVHDPQPAALVEARPGTSRTPWTA